MCIAGSSGMCECGRRFKDMSVCVVGTLSLGCLCVWWEVEGCVSGGKLRNVISGCVCVVWVQSVFVCVCVGLQFRGMCV